jgi:hypothetical protein
MADPARNFQVLRAAVGEERNKWVRFWKQSPAMEAAAHPAYAELFCGPHDRAMCALQSFPGGGTIFYPFIYRSMAGFCTKTADHLQYGDITTPYGYGGPQYWGGRDVDSENVIFWRNFDAWAVDNNIVSEFVRFGLGSDSQLPYPGEVVVRSRNIVRSLDLEPELLWMNFAHKVRKNVKAAQRSGVTVRIDETGQEVSEFLRIYHDTMDRRSADSSYSFPIDFFESIHKELQGSFAYFHAIREGKVVSTELVLLSRYAAYSFLGGTDSDAFEFRPNDLLKYEIMRWAMRRGILRYVLGGGASPGDGIEKYKRGFAPNGSVDFVSGQRVLLPEIYRALVEKAQQRFSMDGRTWPSDSAYFPAYRIAL